MHDLYGLHATAELEGNHPKHFLWSNRRRAASHAFPRRQRSNMAPGKGAWGYVEDPERKILCGRPNSLLARLDHRLSYLRDWYKYRKVVVVNPVNGKVIIADIADSGPASWTGKHFGGSPEIMAYLNLNVGMQKGPVILFFVNDPADQVPLGPLEYNLENPPLLTNG